MQLKQYQQAALEQLQRYLQALTAERERAVKAAEFGIKHKWDEAGWDQIARPATYHAKRNAIGESVPNICLKVPTGGGKTLLGVKAIDLINAHYRATQMGTRSV